MLREDNGLALCRGAVDVEGKPVLELAAGSDAPGERAKLEREFVLRDVLEQEWAARPMALVTDGDRPVLLLSDPGGLLLSERVGGTWELETFLRVGTGIARSLDRAHLAGLTHRDIKPGNILFDVGSGRAWLAENAILIVEYASLKYHEGLSPSAAALEAARLRFRPIVMTSLAFILGVLPLAISTGAGAGARRSVGTGVMGGMLAATFLAVFFVPMFFKVITERRLKESRTTPEIQAEVARAQSLASDEPKHSSQVAAVPSGREPQGDLT